MVAWLQTLVFSLGVFDNALSLRVLLVLVFFLFTSALSIRREMA